MSKPTTKGGKSNKNYGSKRKRDDVKSGNGKGAYNREEAETSAVGDNNPSWYIPDPEVMDQATRVSFSNFIGVPVEFDPSKSVPLLGSGALDPGAVMQVFINPSPGYTTWSHAKNAAINQQAFRTYAALSSINAKNTNYTPNDVATVILAMGEIISMFAVAQRAYGLLWTYNVRNRLLPKGIVSLSGIDASILSRNAASYLTRLNTLIVEANKIPFPASVQYFGQCAEIFSGVYADSDSSMSELYIPLPYSTWDLEEDAVLEGTVLKTRKLWEDVAGYTAMDPDDFLDLIQAKIETMLTSTTYNMVYSDIVNLATKDSSVTIMSFVPVSPDYSVSPVYDKEFLLKINNATILGEPLAKSAQFGTDHTASNDVVPDKDILSLKYAPQWSREIPDLGLLKLFNFYVDNPTLEERVIATRYMAASGLDPDGPLKSKGDPAVHACYTNQTVGMGDHYIVGIRVSTDGETSQYVALTSGHNITDGLHIPSVLTRFSQHPYIYEFDYSAEFGTYDLVGLIGDLEFFTTLDFNTLARINRLALFALFDIKGVTKAV